MHRAYALALEAVTRELFSDRASSPYATETPAVAKNPWSELEEPRPYIQSRDFNRFSQGNPDGFLTWRLSKISVRRPDLFLS